MSIARMSPNAIFIVRATVLDPRQRAAFDDWYETDHLPKAVAAMGVERYARYWSVLDPALHYAVYEIEDPGPFVARVARNRTMIAEGGTELEGSLVAEFMRAFPDVTFSYEVIVRS